MNSSTCSSIWVFTFLGVTNFWHLDGVLQRLPQKVVIVRDLEIQISGRIKRTLNFFLCTRSFAVGHSNEELYVSLWGNVAIKGSFGCSVYHFILILQLVIIKSFHFYLFIVWTHSLHCTTILPLKWTTYVVHELVKRGLEGDRLMELLPGWEKVSQRPPLVPSPPRFQLIYGWGGWDFDVRWKEGKECKDKLWLGL